MKPQDIRRANQLMEYASKVIVNFQPNYNSLRLQEIIDTGFSKSHPYWKDFAELNRKYFSENSDIHVRVRVDRTRKLHDYTHGMLLPFAKSINPPVVNAMPLGLEGEVNITFFKIGEESELSVVNREYMSRSLVPVDPFALITYNSNHISFCLDFPNRTFWRDQRLGMCEVSFSNESGVPTVSFSQRSIAWGPEVWFAGVSQPPTQS